jgi:hypothetical protein
MKVGMAADQMPVRGNPAGQSRIRLRPAALDEHRRPNVCVSQDVQQVFRDADARRSIGMLHIERQCDAQRGYFSTPVMTMPRWNER